jgi:STIP1 homology and U-box containing protein 1
MNDSPYITEAEALEAAKTMFIQKKYDKAIYFYKIGNKINPANNLIYSNLGICYYNLKDYSSAVEQCNLALELNPTNIKALVFKSKSLALQSKANKNHLLSQESLSCLILAQSLCRIPEFTSYLQMVLALQKKVSLLNAFLEEDYKKNVVIRLREYYSKVLNVNVFLLLNDYLVDYIRVEIPLSITCPITLDIFNEPVVTPSGNTYEKRYLLEFCAKIGSKDPVTKENFASFQLIDNLNVKSAAEGFKQAFPWTEHYLTIGPEDINIESS